MHLSEKPRLAGCLAVARGDSEVRGESVTGLPSPTAQSLGQREGSAAQGKGKSQWGREPVEGTGSAVQEQLEGVHRVP